MRTPTLPLLAALLVTSFAPLAQAQGDTSRIELDVQDLPEDIIVDPRQGPSYVGARDTIDVVRYVQRVEGSDVILEMTFAAGPGEPRAVIDFIGQMGPQVGQGFLLEASWDASGALPASADISYTIGAMRTTTATVETEGRTVRFTFPLPPEATCMTVSGSVQVRVGDIEYSDWISPDVSPCQPQNRLDGAQGDCPPATTTVDVAGSFEDARGDVRSVDARGLDSDVVPGEGQHDITSVSTRRDGDRVVQTVTLAEPRNASRELKLQVYGHVSADRDAYERPEDALIAQYWRFANGSQQDRSHGEFTSNLGGGKFPVELSVEGSTYTFSWCASLLPANARCFSVEVVVTEGGAFLPRLRDVAAPPRDACAGVATFSPSPATRPTVAATTTSADEEMVDEEEPADEEPANETPGLALVALLGAVALVARARRLTR
ncbi:MAG TPA: hypothetical protein VFH78_10620 [Candidatus Thermoplasmatota archaeon]|nr:hypothetical protein [Candidatus Thermoplasmatota archaeon]